MRHCLFYLLVIVIAGKSYADPVIACKQPVRDFGVVAPDEPLEHVYVLSNTGDTTLHIKRVRACCGTKHNIASRTIGPGESSDLSVSLSLKGQRGEIRKTIYVESNDREQPYFQLQMVGVVVDSAEVVPGAVFFHSPSRVCTEEQEVRIVCRPGIVLKVTNIVSTVRYFKGELSGMHDKGPTIKIRATAPLPMGSSKAMIGIYTDHPMFRVFWVDVRARVRSRIVFAPHEIVLRQEEAEDEPQECSLLLRSRTGTPFKVLQVIAPRPEIDVRVTSINERCHRCELSNITSLTDLDGRKVIIKTDDESAGEIEVPIRVIGK